MAAAVLTFAACAGQSADKYTLRDQAIELYSQGDYAAAINRFDEALLASDGQVSELQYDILRYKAECQLRIGDYNAAKTSYEALLQLDEVQSSVDEYNSLLSQLDALNAVNEANNLFNAGEYNAAYESLSTYASLDGGLAGRIAWYNMAVCKEYLGDFDTAYTLLAEYNARFPDDADVKKELEFCRSRSDAGNET